MSTAVEGGGQNGQQQSGGSSSASSHTEVEEFRPSKRTWLIFLTLSVLTLMVALDGTSISVALPVRIPIA